MFSPSTEYFSLSQAQHTNLKAQFATGLERKTLFWKNIQALAVLPEQIHYDQLKAPEKVINSNLGFQ